uniref:Uncharacterized protein n=1 Tax=Anguilla anguilla TaxID=7936 RepID=A0A0E9Y186_ANGAN
MEHREFEGISLINIDGNTLTLTCDVITIMGNLNFPTL